MDEGPDWSQNYQNLQGYFLAIVLCKLFLDGKACSCRLLHQTKVKLHIVVPPWFPTLEPLIFGSHHVALLSTTKWLRAWPRQGLRSGKAVRVSWMQAFPSPSEGCLALPGRLATSTTADQGQSMSPMGDKHMPRRVGRAGGFVKIFVLFTF